MFDFKLQWTLDDSEQVDFLWNSSERTTTFWEFIFCILEIGHLV